MYVGDGQSRYFTTGFEIAVTIIGTVPEVYILPTFSVTVVLEAVEPPAETE